MTKFSRAKASSGFDANVQQPEITENIELYNNLTRIKRLPNTLHQAGFKGAASVGSTSIRLVCRG
ncbi:hypothetical protein XW59_013430 [Aquamicrobium sp. LC103]|nr:hypothetical protein XW59_013430 [Aquamicrobium sp. LC103]